MKWRTPARCWRAARVALVRRETPIRSRSLISRLRRDRLVAEASSDEGAYNRIAGGALERLAALSDGVFAFAMTLLVLDMHVPPIGAVHSEVELWHALLALLPRFVMYAMSFLTLGIFWVGQQTQLNQLAVRHDARRRGRSQR